MGEKTSDRSQNISFITSPVPKNKLKGQSGSKY